MLATTQIPALLLCLSALLSAVCCAVPARWHVPFWILPVACACADLMHCKCHLCAVGALFLLAGVRTLAGLVLLGVYACSVLCELSCLIH